MKNVTKLMACAVASAIVCGSAVAVDTQTELAKTVEKRIGFRADKVTPTPYMGLYELYGEGQVIYADAKGEVILIGSILDAKENAVRNVTSERLNKLTAVKFDELPLDKAVKIVRGNGRRVLVTFEDPNCGYCKKLAQEIRSLNNVTVYTFLYPILSQDSKQKSDAIWCASDNAKAWQDMMLEGKAPPEAGKDCVTPVQDVVALGKKLRITGTPTMIFADGERAPGFIPLQQIEQKLDAAARKK